MQPSSERCSLGSLGISVLWLADGPEEAQEKLRLPASAEAALDGTEQNCPPQNTEKWDAAHVLSSPAVGLSSHEPCLSSSVPRAPSCTPGQSRSLLCLPMTSSADLFPRLEDLMPGNTQLPTQKASCLPASHCGGQDQLAGSVPSTQEVPTAPGGQSRLQGKEDPVSSHAGFSCSRLDLSPLQEEHSQSDSVLKIFSLPFTTRC